MAELEQLCVDTGYSRFPVVGDDGALDGYVHLKDVVATPDADRGEPLASARVRSLAQVGGQDSLSKVLATMQRHGAHMAAVLTPQTGQVAGVVALEDVLEELVGEVRDTSQHVGDQAGGSSLPTS